MLFLINTFFLHCVLLHDLFHRYHLLKSTFILEHFLSLVPTAFTRRWVCSKSKILMLGHQNNVNIQMALKHWTLAINPAVRDMFGFLIAAGVKKWFCSKSQQLWQLSENSAKWRQILESLSQNERERDISKIWLAANTVRRMIYEPIRSGIFTHSGLCTMYPQACAHTHSTRCRFHQLPAALPRSFHTITYLLTADFATHPTLFLVFL